MIRNKIISTTISLVAFNTNATRLWIIALLLMLSCHINAENNNLMQRFIRVDTTLTVAELRTLYLSYSLSAAYKTSVAQLPNDPLLAVEQRPLSLQALFDAAIAMKHKGKKKLMARYARQMWMLGEMLHNEYAGNAEDPYPLLYREDESIILYNWEHIDSIVKVTVKPDYDVVECALPPDWIDYYYFRLLYNVNSID